MGKVELKYYCAIPDRYGKIRHYFRIRKKYYPLPAPTSPTSMEEYNALLAEHAPRAAIMRQGRGNGPLEKTLDWVVEKYKAESAEWKKLKSLEQRDLQSAARLSAIAIWRGGPCDVHRER